MEKMTTLWIREKTKIRVASTGKKGETYDEIVNNLVDVYEEVKSDHLIEEKIK